MRIRLRNVVIGAGIAAGVATLITVLVVQARNKSEILAGVVLREDTDPAKQVPIADVKIQAIDADKMAEGASDVAGFFRIKLPRDWWREQPVSLSFQHPDYESVELKPVLNAQTMHQLYVVRMEPVPQAVTIPVSTREIAVKDVRIRYAEKSTTTANVGSTAKIFTIKNTGNVPCGDQPPCSPDGRWKATVGGVTIDAGPGQKFKNPRVSCIAGPCPFTKIETGAVPQPGRTITVMVRNWSDTVTFLIEAEVTRDMPLDTIQQAYPAINGRSMSFTLPAEGEGPSIQADVGGSDIVFPLGPALQLSWARCTLQVSADKTKLYQCELKPGYEFQ